MKRTATPDRSAPMQRGTPLRRSPLLSASVPAKPRRRVRDTGPSKAVRRLVHKRSGGQCEFPHCGRPAEHCHHRRPRAAGGSSDPATNQASNLLGFCAGHHGWTESHRAGALVFGLLVPSGADPPSVPVVTRHASGAVLLDDAGGWTEVAT